jgi:hypothetical protein
MGLVGRIDVEADDLLCHVCIFFVNGVYRATITKDQSSTTKRVLLSRQSCFVSCNNSEVFYGCSQQACCRDLVKIALTVPNGKPVLFAIFRAPIPASWFSERMVRTVSSGRGGLPSLLPLARATRIPAIVRSDILALSCFASVANIEIITSLNGPVESSHCS